MAGVSVRPFHPYNSTRHFPRGRGSRPNSRPVNCTRIEKVYLNSRLLEHRPPPNLVSGRPINYAFSHCSRNEQQHRRLDPARGCPPGVPPLPPRYRRDPEWGEKRNEDKEGGRKEATKARERIENKKRRRRRKKNLSNDGCLPRWPPPSFRSETMGLYIVRHMRAKSY